MSSDDDRLANLNLSLGQLLDEYKRFREGDITELTYLRRCCQAVSHFFYESGAPGEAAVAFMALTKYFDGLLARGETSLIGMEATTERRPRTKYRAFLIAMAAACMDVLMDPGGEDSKVRAAEVVARHCSKWPGIGDPTKITTTTIANWRDGFLQASTKDRAEFDALCAAFRQEASPPGKVHEILQFGPPSGPET